MVKTEHEIVEKVYAAKTDSQAADALIQQYLGFIRNEVARAVYQTDNGREDEESIAMFAFYEAILSYEKGRGAFLSYAARAIRNRLIDYYRKEKRHRKIISLDTPFQEEDEGNSLMDTLADQSDHFDGYAHREASQQEIREFEKKLEEFGISFSDVADNCPRQKRTFSACLRVLEYAREHPELLEQLLRSRKLPVNELSAGSGTDRKTMERHRKYLVAILLAFTNGYEIIRGHLCQLGEGKEEAAI